MERFLVKVPGRVGTGARRLANCSPEFIVWRSSVWGAARIQNVAPFAGAAAALLAGPLGPKLRLRSNPHPVRAPRCMQQAGGRCRCEFRIHGEPVLNRRTPYIVRTALSHRSP